MAKRKGVEEVAIVISDKNGVADLGSMRAVGKILENRTVEIMISKDTLKELAKKILDGEEQEPKEKIVVRLEYSPDKQDENKSYPKGKIIAY